MLSPVVFGMPVIPNAIPYPKEFLMNARIVFIAIIAVIAYVIITDGVEQ